MSGGSHYAACEARGGKLCAMVEEAVVYFFHQVIPTSGFVLAEEAHGRVPRCVSAMQTPSPVGSVGEQCPYGFAEGSSKVGGGGVHGNYHVGTGWDQETKTDVPGSYWLVGEDSLYDQEIQLENNTPHESSGVENKIIASETVWYQENLIWEDGTRVLLTQAAEYRIEAITNDTSLTVTRASLDGTDIVPFWKMATETETTAKIAGFNNR